MTVLLIHHFLRLHHYRHCWRFSPGRYAVGLLHERIARGL